MRVRLGRVDLSDLNLFEFDYDLTFMVFFLNHDEKIYARYGARDAVDADSRQSLEGLRHTMQSVLRTHQVVESNYAPKSSDKPFFVREETGVQGGGCLHCHQVRERINRKIVADGEWSRDHAYRFPLPDNLGILLQVDRGNLVNKIIPESAAAKAGLQPGDQIQKIGNVPIHSLADATFALDKAPTNGDIAINILRAGKPIQVQVNAREGWKKSDISWRPSMRFLKPAFAIYGPDLTPAEKQQFHLNPKQLAYRQSNQLSDFARSSGIQSGDIILGLDSQPMNLDADQFVRKIQKEFLVGDTISLNILRDNKPMKVTLVLRGR